jgi:hypothetical protein
MGLLLLGVEAGESSANVTNRGIRAEFYTTAVAVSRFLANIRTPKGVSSL